MKKKAAKKALKAERRNAYKWIKKHMDFIKKPYKRTLMDEKETLNHFRTIRYFHMMANDQQTADEYRLFKGYDYNCNFGKFDPTVNYWELDVNQYYNEKRYKQGKTTRNCERQKNFNLEKDIPEFYQSVFHLYDVYPDDRKDYVFRDFPYDGYYEIEED